MCRQGTHATHDLAVCHRRAPCSRSADNLWRACLRIILAAFLLLATRSTSLAGPVGAATARKAAHGWLQLDARPLGADLGATVDRAETFTNGQGQPLYYIVYLDPSGFLILPADDEVEPIIGFVSGDTYDPTPDNPLAALIEKDLPARLAIARDAAGAVQAAAGPVLGSLHDSAAARQMAAAQAAEANRRAHAKWQLLLSQQDSPAGSIPLLVSSIPDVRIAPLIQSRWNQGSVCGDYCFNYFTPSHYVCGCTATALAQVLRFFQHPTAGIGPKIFTIQVSGIPRTAYARGGDGSGGPYPWSQMPLIPDCGLTTTQRQAIGALCHDAGLSVGMLYDYMGSGQSAAWINDCKTALVSTFGYANAISAGDGWNNIGTALNTMLNPNLDAGYPCLLGIANATVGHAIVTDGYGYDLSTLYHHLNMGWSGANDAWYNLPAINTNYYTFTVVDECVYNIFVTGTGEIISGRIVDAAGNPLSGATVTAQRSGGTCTTVSNDNGVYALAKVPSNSTYTLSAARSGYTFAGRIVTTGKSVDSQFSGNVWAADLVGTAAPPPAPTNPDPAHNQPLVAVNTVLAWVLDTSQGSWPLTCDVHLGTANPPTTLVAENLAGTTWSPGLLQADTTYYWQVVARTSDSQTPGPIWQFHTTIRGDITCDGYVNVGDLQALISHWGAHAISLPADLNGDTYVNVGDLQILVASWDRSP